jgi:hypothetical protein
VSWKRGARALGVVAALVAIGVALWGVSLLAGASSTRPTGAVANDAAASRPLRLAPPRSIYWGATVKNSLGQAPWEMGAARAFERAAGKKVSIIGWGSPFYSKVYCQGYCEFQTEAFTKVRGHGSIPFLSWGPYPGNGSFSPAAIARGAQDSYIRRWAQAARDWGHPFFLRFAWEMNGFWYPWGVGAPGNTAADVVAMWRHVHDLFVSEGTTNVTWVWCPNIGSFAPLGKLYPGNAYVDWTGLDGYNFDPSNWATFGDLYKSSYRQITGSIAPTKPLVLAEVATTESGGSKGAWITNMFTTLPSLFPKVRALMWFDVRTPGPGNRADWPIESSPSATAAFDRGIASAAYTSDTFANLNRAPIPPP